MGEFKNSTYNAINEAKLYANEINGMSESTRVRLFKQLTYYNEDYINIEDNKMIVDCNLANLDIVNFKRIRVIYNSTANLQNELANNGYIISSHTYNQVLNKLESSENNRMSFKDLFDEYVRLKTCKPMFSFEFPDKQCAVIERKYELVKDAYKILGPEKVREMKYNVSNIKRAITQKLDSPTINKIVSLIDQSISPNEAIPVRRIKAMLKEIYAQLNIKATAKASDLSK